MVHGPADANNLHALNREAQTENICHLICFLNKFIKIPVVNDAKINPIFSSIE